MSLSAAGGRVEQIAFNNQALIPFYRSPTAARVNNLVVETCSNKVDPTLAVQLDRALVCFVCVGS